MRFSPKKLYALTVTLSICAILGARGESAAQVARPSGWYMGAGVGINKTSGVKQAGYNRDDICYPEDDCSHVGDGGPDGYRWYYDLDAGEGAAFEISIGRVFGAFRLELALSQWKNDIDQNFTGIIHLNGSPRVAAEDSDYEVRSENDIDELTTRTLSLNIFYDFSLQGSRMTPYLGAGLGVSSVELSGLYYRSYYSCKAFAPACDSPGRYNSHQDEDISETVFSAHLHAGLDYRLSEKMLLGLKFSYSMVDDIEDAEGEYIEHAVSGISNFTTINGMNHWSLMVGIKYFFGE